MNCTTSEKNEIWTFYVLRFLKYLKASFFETIFQPWYFIDVGNRLCDYFRQIKNSAVTEAAPCCLSNVNVAAIYCAYKHATGPRSWNAIHSMHI